MIFLMLKSKQNENKIPPPNQQYLDSSVQGSEIELSKEVWVKIYSGNFRSGISHQYTGFFQIKGWKIFRSKFERSLDQRSKFKRFLDIVLEIFRSKFGKSYVQS